VVRPGDEHSLALTLRTLGGLISEETAQAFSVAESTIAQRMVRAERTILFERPATADHAARLSGVLEVIYPIFNEGYPTTAARPGCIGDLARRRCACAGTWPR
jgi:predicted RNA polymerase sigma factor